MYMQMDDWKFI